MRESTIAKGEVDSSKKIKASGGSRRILRVLVGVK